MNNNNSNNDTMSDDEDEEECRVCRGPAEEGHPLFKPCRCSGSIGLCHQDCLTSWLNVKNHKRCELCKFKFQFSPQYKPDTPEILGLGEILVGVASRMCKVAPLILRVLFAASLWLIVAPLNTSYLYHGWMSRRETILSRFQNHKVDDIIAGVIIICIIVLSFLSLMSFVDFLRLEAWEHRPRPPHNIVGEEEEPAPVLDHVWDDEEESSDENDTNYESEIEDDVSWDEFADSVESGDDDDDSSRSSSDSEVELLPPPPNNLPQNPPDMGEVEVDINIALDELLGVRGPIGNVLRNLLWLMAFNALFLCFFAFLPRTVGVGVSGLFLNHTNNTGFAFNETTNNVTLSSVWKAIDATSIRNDSAFRLYDFYVILVGYFSLAFCMIVVQCVRMLSRTLRSWGRDEREEGREERGALGEMNRLVQGLNNDDDFANLDLGSAAGALLDAAAAVVKVGVLLFVKMFILPVALGMALDASTTTLLGHSIENFIEYAGRDIFSFVLFHWVAGITFMLLVTVSVLQLREVAHPELLGHVIRPQEPHPDLLGNLLHDSVYAHAKRMALSLIIYALLLALHVYIPLRFGVTKYIMNRFDSHLHLKFAYVLTPQLQVPLELLVFHLCMLALLERYKNGLGGMQHRWLKFMGAIMGLSDRLLPHDVKSFKFIGSRKLFSSPKQVDKVWLELSRRNKDTVSVLEANLHKLESCESDRFTHGNTNTKGERVLCQADFISLTSRNMERRSIMIPTRIGKYRLDRSGYSPSAFRIKVWEEIRGKPISRPPEGWDDLGAGGADVQGRWAWNQERKSAIEYSVAQRIPFFPKGQSPVQSLMIGVKLVLLGLFSWLAASMLLCLVAVVPLAIGRMLYSVLEVPENWMHDPLGYGIGFFLCFPVVRTTSIFLTQSEHNFFRRFVGWLRAFHYPTLSKLKILWKALSGYFCVAPLLLGSVYRLAIRPTEMYLVDVEHPTDVLGEAWKSWIVGAVLMHLWAQFCIYGVFTRHFRILILEGRQLDNNNEETWMGEKGYIGMFFQKLHNIKYFEWDQIDETVLIQNVVSPFLRNLFWLWSVPYVSSYLLASFQVETFRSLVVRCVLGVTGLVELSLFYRQEIKAWLQAAHRLARDDRYLIGEILMNHPGE